MTPSTTPTTIRQYRAQLFDENSTVTITSTSLQDCQRKVRAVVNSPRFESLKDTNTQTVYSESHFKGAQPVGWIAEIEVPEVLSVKHVTEQRMAAQRAA